MTQANGTPKTAEQEQALPLFYKQPVVLDAERHGKAGLSNTEDASFASAANSIYINAAEFIEACKHYPIVFTMGDNPLPAIITGLEKTSYFVSADGKWRKDTYIPAYVRRYPFLFMHVPEEGKYVLCVDESSSLFRNKAERDEVPFYCDGKPGEMVTNALTFCTAFQRQVKPTEEFCRALHQHGLLSPTRSDAKLPGGRELKLSGFQIIDEGKFNQLPDKTFLEFHKKGWLALIFFALLAASNWRRVIALAAEREAN